MPGHSRVPQRCAARGDGRGQCSATVEAQQVLGVLAVAGADAVQLRLGLRQRPVQGRQRPPGQGRVAGEDPGQSRNRGAPSQDIQPGSDPGDGSSQGRVLQRP